MSRVAWSLRTDASRRKRVNRARAVEVRLQGRKDVGVGMVEGALALLLGCSVNTSRWDVGGGDPSSSPRTDRVGKKSSRTGLDQRDVAAHAQP